MFKNKYTGTASLKGAIWDEFSERHHRAFL